MSNNDVTISKSFNHSNLRDKRSLESKIYIYIQPINKKRKRSFIFLWSNL